jgi:type IX secretion system PorP/SprF family membrane protein
MIPFNFITFVNKNCFPNMRNGILIILFILYFKVGSGQDPAFSQFFANPMYLNPAFTGTTELPRITVNYRNQWPQKGTTFNTYSLSYDQLLNKANAGLGFQIMRDEELNNIINTSFATVSYSYHLKLGFESFMTLGIQGGLVFKQFNIGTLVFPSGINQLTGEVTEWVSNIYSDENRLYPDFSVGAIGQHGEYFWGAAVSHLNRPNESIIEGDQKGRVPIKVTVHGGGRLHRLHYGLLSREFTLSPNILYQQQGSFKQVNLGIYMIEKSFQFGGWFRNNLDIRPDALIFLAGFVQDKFQLGYSFDYTISKLSNYSYGSHEISFTIFPGRKKDTPIRDKLIIPMI